MQDQFSSCHRQFYMYLSYPCFAKCRAQTMRTVWMSVGWHRNVPSLQPGFAIYRGQLSRRPCESSSMSCRLNPACSELSEADVQPVWKSSVLECSESACPLLLSCAWKLQIPHHSLAVQGNSPCLRSGLFGTFHTVMLVIPWVEMHALRAW